MRRWLLCFGLFVFAGVASADDAPLYHKRDCDRVISSATAFHQCYSDNLAAANKALNTLYHQLMTQEPFYVGSAAKLRDLERSWIVFKEKECAYEYGDKPVSEDYWLGHADCEIRMTEQRIRELQGRPSCTGGGSVCTPHMR